MLEIKYEQSKEKIYKIINFYTQSLTDISDYQYEFFIPTFYKLYAYRLTKRITDDVCVRYELSVNVQGSGTLVCYVDNCFEVFKPIFRHDLNTAEIISFFS